LEAKHPLEEKTGQRNVCGNVITLEESCACYTCSLEKLENRIFWCGNLITCINH